MYLNLVGRRGGRQKRKPKPGVLLHCCDLVRIPTFGTMWSSHPWHPGHGTGWSVCRSMALKVRHQLRLRHGSDTERVRMTLKSMTGKSSRNSFSWKTESRLHDVFCLEGRSWCLRCGGGRCCTFWNLQPCAPGESWQQLHWGPLAQWFGSKHSLTNGSPTKSRKLSCCWKGHDPQIVL